MLCNICYKYITFLIFPFLVGNWVVRACVEMRWNKKGFFRLVLSSWDDESTFEEWRSVCNVFPKKLASFMLNTGNLLFPQFWKLLLILLFHLEKSFAQFGKTILPFTQLKSTLLNITFILFCCFAKWNFWRMLLLVKQNWLSLDGLFIWLKWVLHPTHKVCPSERCSSSTYSTEPHVKVEVSRYLLNICRQNICVLECSTKEIISVNWTPMFGSMLECDVRTFCFEI